MSLTDIKENNITNEELEVIGQYIDGLSDMDMGYDRETGEKILVFSEDLDREKAQSAK